VRNKNVQSFACRREHFDTAWYKHWSSIILPQNPNLLHRKHWEWAAICQALHERGMLAEGRRGLGFAVGKEALISLFASTGATIEATDLDAEDHGSESWKNGNQWGGNIESLFVDRLISEADFKKRARYYPVDMRDISTVQGRDYDFIWSSCSFEHLGSLELGLKFVEESSRLLAPGGYAVHTTEFNCTSDTTTIEHGPSVVYRKRDLIGLRDRLTAQGFIVEPFDFDIGTADEDALFDFPPYYGHGRQHIKLLFDGFVITSFALVIHRPSEKVKPSLVSGLRKVFAG
jgi:SAM-dependent methyltransferase